jgi:Rieske Fe-S protein
MNAEPSLSSPYALTVGTGGGKVAAGRTGIDRKMFLRLGGAGLAASLSVLVGVRRARAAIRVAAPTKPWDISEFEYEAEGKTFPGFAVRLPGGDRGLYVACRICPHQGCIFGYETNYELVGDIIGRDLPNPVLFCRCHMSVFDPAQGGRVLNGPAPRPPWTFTAEEKEGEVVISSIETGAGEIR